jgi:hypothetical protein
LKERVVYSDTNSVICGQCGQTPVVTSGDKLGDMMNELGPDEYSKELVPGGPRKW